MYEPRPLPFVGPGPDRAAHLRNGSAAAVARGAPAARVVPVGPGAGVVLAGASRLARLPVDAAQASAELTLLGLDADGGAVFAFDAGTDAAAVAPDGTRRDGRAGPLAFTPLRDAAPDLEASEAALAAHAVAIVAWHRGAPPLRSLRRAHRGRTSRPLAALPELRRA